MRRVHVHSSQSTPPNSLGASRIVPFSPKHNGSDSHCTTYRPGRTDTHCATASGAAMPDKGLDAPHTLPQAATSHYSRIPSKRRMDRFCLPAAVNRPPCASDSPSPLVVRARARWSRSPCAPSDTGLPLALGRSLLAVSWAFPRSLDRWPRSRLRLTSRAARGGEVRCGHRGRRDRSHVYGVERDEVRSNWASSMQMRNVWRDKLP